MIRNVLIYFDANTKRRVLERVVRQSRPDGFVLLGAGESVVGVTDRLRAVPLGGTRFFVGPDHQIAA